MATDPRDRARLLLFDLDGTLVEVHGAGRVAMTRAASDLFGDGFTFDAVDMGGKLDPLIFAEAAAANGVDPTPHHAPFREAYHRHLADVLAGDHPRAALPGAGEVLDALHTRGRDTLGVLTGNFAETGTLKLDAVGLTVERFTCRVWGDAAPSRPGLVGVALQRHPDFAPRNVLVIGDTVHDVACAKAHGCVSVAVTTGRAAARELRDAGADHVIDDLREFAW